jgi:anaerobic magnesium-protoporphyrin IX monomethyl ester cyclase
MKVLLIYPRDFKNSVKDNIGRAPLGLNYIKSYVEYHSNHQVKIIDCYSEIDDLNQLFQVIKKEKPKIIGISINSRTYLDVKIISKRIKKELPGIKIVLGGLLANVYPKKLLKEIESDYVISGDGELGFFRLTQYLEGKISFNQLPKTYYKNNDEIIFSNNNDYIQNLDEIPIPKRNLKKYNYYKNKNSKTVSILTSRGCYGNCSFCAHRLVFGNKIRRRSIDNVIQEIKYLRHKYKIKSYYFIDSNFVEYDYTIKICKEIIKQKLDIKWSCQTRIDSLFEINNSEKSIIRLLKLMKKSGCENITLGVESGVQEILDKNNKNSDMRKNEVVFNSLKEMKISYYTVFVLGLIGDTKKTMNQTLKYIEKIESDNKIIMPAIPIPGTEFYEHIKNKIIGGPQYWKSNEQNIREGKINYGDFTTDDIVKIIKKEEKKLKFDLRHIKRRLNYYLHNLNSNTIKELLEGIKIMISK